VLAIVLSQGIGDQAPEAPAGSWASRGQLALEGRMFRGDQDPGTVDHGLTLFGRAEVQHEYRATQQRVRAFGRGDAFDRARAALIVEEAWAQVSGERIRVRAGFDIVTWTTTEAFHPADVINARNWDSDLENLEKIGEPMLSVQLRASDTTVIELHATPHRTRPMLPSPRSRLTPMPGLSERPAIRFLDRSGRPADGQWAAQGALAARQITAAGDFGIHLLEHNDRLQPLARAQPDGLPPLLVFQTVRQAGLTYQHAVGPLVAKLEAVYRWFVAPAEAAPGQPDHGLAAAGVEYGWSHEGGRESTLIVEAQTVYGAPDQASRAQLTPFQRDLLLGYRLALNDQHSQEVTAVAIADGDRPGEGLLAASYQLRLGDTWTSSLSLRLFTGRADDPGPIAALRAASHVRINVIRHF
jgi:hypothetical protein